MKSSVGVGNGKASERRGRFDRGVSKRFEEIEDGFAGGDKGGVFAPCRVLDDTVEIRTEDAARAGTAAKWLGGSHEGGSKSLGVGFQYGGEWEDMTRGREEIDDFVVSRER